MILLNKQAANTDGTQKTIMHPTPNKFGIATVIASGTFDGATVSLECKGALGDWAAISDASFSQAGSVTLLGGGFELRGVVTGAGASTSVNLEVVS